MFTANGLAVVVARQEHWLAKYPLLRQPRGGEANVFQLLDSEAADEIQAAGLNDAVLAATQRWFAEGANLQSLRLGCSGSAQDGRRLHTRTRRSPSTRTTQRLREPVSRQD